ncbi:sugar phosphate isomerase/epimerase [Myxococcota bacterium]|nr:sugar phosphate isomerase/epimerase [Myxococcota bacterium]
MAWKLSYCTLDRSTMFGLPETLERQTRAAAAAGFERMSLDLFSLRAHRDAHGGVQRVRAALDATGLAVYDLTGITITDDRAKTLAELDEFLAFADDLGATWIQSRMPIDNVSSRRVYAEVADRVSSAGYGLAFEYSSFVPIRSLRQASDFVSELAQRFPRQAMMIDSWHFFQCGDTLESLRDFDPSLFGYLQLDDALEPGPDSRFDTLNRRTLPGMGNLDLVGFMAAWNALGVGGVVSPEVMNEDLRRLELEDYVAQVAATTRGVLAKAEAVKPSRRA